MSYLTFISRRQHCLLISLFVSFTPTVHAESNPSPSTPTAATTEIASLDLITARTLALEHQPSLANARAAVAKAHAELKGSRLLPNPTLQLEGEEIPKNWDLGAGLTMLTLNQTLITGGKRKYRIGVATRGIDRAELLYEQEALEVIRKVDRAFYQLLGTIRKGRIAGDLSKIASRFHQLVRTRVTEGVARPLEGDRTLVLSAQAEFEMKRAEAEQRIARQSLATEIGLPVEQLGEVTGELDRENSLPPLEELTQKAHESSPLLRIPSIEEEIAQQELLLGRAQRIPDVDLGLGVQHQRDPERDHSLRGFQVSVPLPVFNDGQAVRQQARADIQGARSRQEKAWQDLQNRIVEAYQNGTRAHDQVGLYQSTILPAARRAISLTEEGYDAGKFTYLDVLDAQRSLASANQSLVEALLDYQRARADLRSLVTEDLRVIPREEPSPKNPSKDLSDTPTESKGKKKPKSHRAHKKSSQGRIQ